MDASEPENVPIQVLFGLVAIGLEEARGEVDVRLYSWRRANNTKHPPSSDGVSRPKRLLRWDGN